MREIKNVTLNSTLFSVNFECESSVHEQILNSSPLADLSMISKDRLVDEKNIYM